jgi:hypothetical protein
MRRLAVAIAVASLAAGPAAAWPEGRFASADGASEVRLLADEDGVVEVVARSPALETTIEAELRRDAESGLWQQAGRRKGWLGRLLGGERAAALPFDGERLVFGREEEGALILTSLEVDGRGRPTLLRLAVADAPGGLRLSVRRFDADGVDAAEPVHLERVTP